MIYPSHSVQLYLLINTDNTPIPRHVQYNTVSGDIAVSFQVLRHFKIEMPLAQTSGITDRAKDAKAQKGI